MPSAISTLRYCIYVFGILARQYLAASDYFNEVVWRRHEKMVQNKHFCDFIIMNTVVLDCYSFFGITRYKFSC
jgi:hypothetical protein